MNKAEIEEQEAALLRAMLKSDVPALDKLIAGSLIFTDHTGRLLGKDDDLDAHRKGFINIDTIDTEDRQIVMYGNTAVVSVITGIKGTFMEEPFTGRLRFTRVWLKATDAWQIIAGHSSLLD